VDGMIILKWILRKRCLGSRLDSGGLDQSQVIVKTAITLRFPYVGPSVSVFPSHIALNFLVTVSRERLKFNFITDVAFSFHELINETAFRKHYISFALGPDAVLRPILQTTRPSLKLFPVCRQ
jgi:hypothetical protein